MDEFEKLEKAIEALEAQRSIIGDAVVDAGVAPLRERLASLREQRKQITVMFVEISNLKLEDAEETSKVINDLWQHLDQIVIDHDGHVDKHVGETVTASWGIEHTQESDPEQAVRAALHIRHYLLQKSLQVRIGISTGIIFFSHVGAETVSVGHAMTLANYLKSNASTNQIIISHDTYRHVRGIFDVQPQPLILAFAGTNIPLQTYTVQSAKPRSFRILSRGVEGVETSMIGRDSELQKLKDALSLVFKTGKTTLMTIVGDAGVGKSRLLYEFDNWVELRDDYIWYFKGRAPLQNTEIPYSLWRDVFAFRFEILESDNAIQVREKLEKGISQFMGKQHIPGAHIIGELLGFDLNPARPTDPKILYERGLEYIAEFFTTVSKDPTVLMLEDLHWADSASINILQYLLQKCTHCKLMIVCTTRPNIFEQYPSWFEGHHVIQLRPLSRSDSRKLIEEILHKVELIPPDFQEIIVERAEGNPFFVEELIKVMMDDRIIVKTRDKWRIEPERMKQFRVPPTLTAVLQARLDNLNPVEKLVLQRASVVGRVFWDRAIEGIEKDQLSQTLSLLCEKEFIYKREFSVFDDATEYAFRHALLREVTYDSVLRRERRQTHAYIANWLKEVADKSDRLDEYAILIAEHYEQAEYPDDAVKWYYRAALQAIAQFASEKALDYIHRAWNLASSDEQRYLLMKAREQIYDLQGARQNQLSDLETLEKLADSLDINLYRAEIALRRANYSLFVNDYENTVKSAKSAIKVASRLSNQEYAANGYLMLGRALLRLQNYSEARKQLNDSLNLSRGFPIIQADALRTLGAVAWYEGDYAEAQQHYEKALILYRKVQDRRGESHTLNNLATVSDRLGDYENARQHIKNALTILREIGDKRGESAACNNYAIIAREQGEYNDAQTYFERALQLSLEINDRYGEAIAHNNLGFVASALGNFDRAQQHYERSLTIRQGTGDKRGECWVYTEMGLMFYRREDHEKALHHIQQAISIAVETHHRPEQARALTILGHIQVMRQNWQEAQNAYQLGLELRQELDQPHMAAEIKAGLAQVALAQGHPEQAQTYIESVLPLLKAPLDGTDDTFQIYITAYQVLKDVQPDKAHEVLTYAYELLQQRADKINDAVLRQSFLEKIPSHRQLIGLKVSL